MTKAFDKIAAGLADAIAFAEGESKAGRTSTPATENHWVEWVTRKKD